VRKPRAVIPLAAGVRSPTHPPSGAAHRLL
jgi:hypothetical protein